MSDETPVDAPKVAMSRNRLIMWIVGGVVVLAVIITAIVFAVMPRESVATPTASPSGSSSPDPASSASPAATAATATPDPSESAVVDPGPFPELDPVAPQEPGSADGIAASLVKFESVTGEVVGPGDVEAAAVRVTVEITNTGTTALDMNLVVVNAYMGEQRDPAETYEQPGGSPVSGSLAAGKTATGVYLFRIPEDRRDDVTFVVDYRAGLPAITFRGPVP